MRFDSARRSSHVVRQQRALTSQNDILRSNTNRADGGMKDIAEHLGLETVSAVVSDFYDRIQEHPRLAEPFGRVTDWPEHKAHLTHFWWVTLGGQRYRDKPYRVAEKHMLAGFTP